MCEMKYPITMPLIHHKFKSGFLKSMGMFEIWFHTPGGGGRENSISDIGQPNVTYEVGGVLKSFQGVHLLLEAKLLPWYLFLHTFLKLNWQINNSILCNRLTCKIVKTIMSFINSYVTKSQTPSLVFPKKWKILLHSQGEWWWAVDSNCYPSCSQVSQCQRIHWHNSVSF